MTEDETATPASRVVTTDTGATIAVSPWINDYTGHECPPCVELNFALSRDELVVRFKEILEEDEVQELIDALVEALKPARERAAELGYYEYKAAEQAGKLAEYYAPPALMEDERLSRFARAVGAHFSAMPVIGNSHSGTVRSVAADMPDTEANVRAAVDELLALGYLTASDRGGYEFDPSALPADPEGDQ